MSKKFERNPSTSETFAIKNLSFIKMKPFLTKETEWCEE